MFQYSFQDLPRQVTGDHPSDTPWEARILIDVESNPEAKEDSDHKVEEAMVSDLERLISSQLRKFDRVERCRGTTLAISLSAVNTRVASKAVAARVSRLADHHFSLYQHNDSRIPRVAVRLIVPETETRISSNQGEAEVDDIDDAVLIEVHCLEKPTH